VPTPSRKKYSAAEIFAVKDKFVQYAKQTDELTAAVTNDGLGDRAGKMKVVTSEPLELAVIKAHSKSLGVTIH